MDNFKVNTNRNIIIKITYMERASSSLIRTVYHGHNTVVPHMGLHLKKNMNASDCGPVRGIRNVVIVTQLHNTYAS